MRRLLSFLIGILILCAFAIVGYTLYQKGKANSYARSAKDIHEIVVLTVNGPTTYFENAAGQLAGFEYDLVQLFSADLGLPVRFEVLPSETQLIHSLENRQGHIAAGTLSPTHEHENHVRFGPSYITVSQQVVYRSDDPKPHSIKDLVGKHIGVLAGSHHAERLKELKKTFENLRWEEFEGESTDDLLDRLSEGTLDIVIADSNWIALSRPFYPDIDVALDLGKSEELAWAFPLAGDDYIYRAAKHFFARIQKDGTLKRLNERYFGNTVRRLRKEDLETFLERVQKVLPQYRTLFHQAQEVSGVDWRLLAAIGYQESHWDPLATSPRNVRGFMMLTEDTADRLGVKNRLDAKESIIAGAKYLALLKDGVPQRVPEPDKTWLAIAAYNQGLGHLEDARILAQRLKSNPDSWNDVKTALTLLSNPAHYATLKHGYARGGEAVIMTETVREYFNILARLEKPYKPLFGLATEEKEKKK